MQYLIVTPFKRPPMTANQAKGAHYMAEAKAKKAVADVVAALATRQGIPRLGPSIITVTWWAPDKRVRDNDSLSPFLKATKDALVKRCGVWPDDHCFWVVQDRMAVKLDRDNPRIEILLTEVTEND